MPGTPIRMPCYWEHRIRMQKNARTFKEVPPGEPPSLVNPPAGCRFHPRCSRIIKGECDVIMPVEQEIEPAHQVSCWIHK